VCECVCESATKTRFMPPVDVPEYNTGNRYAYYTNYDVLSLLEEALEDQNDNLGNDIASKDGRTMFRRVPVNWVPYLDANNLEGGEQDPVYGINWGEFKVVFLKGFYLKEGKPMMSPKQHNVFESHVDLTYNFQCTNRRAQFVLNKSA